MQWWLTAEPKDQDLLKTAAYASGSGFLTVRGSRVNTKAYLILESGFLSLEIQGGHNSTNFPKWWKDFKFWEVTKGCSC